MHALKGQETIMPIRKINAELIKKNNHSFDPVFNICHGIRREDSCSQNKEDLGLKRNKIVYKPVF